MGRNGDCVPCGRKRSRNEDQVISPAQAKSLVQQTASADANPEPAPAEESSE